MHCWFPVIHLCQSQRGEIDKSWASGTKRIIRQWLSAWLRRRRIWLIINFTGSASLVNPWLLTADHRLLSADSGPWTTQSTSVHATASHCQFKSAEIYWTALMAIKPASTSTSAPGNRVALPFCFEVDPGGMSSWAKTKQFVDKLQVCNFYTYFIRELKDVVWLSSHIKWFFSRF